MKSKDKSRFGYDHSFQERIVRTLAQDPDFLISVGVPHLDPYYFENRVHRWFAETMIAYAKDHSSGPTSSAIKIAANYAFTSGKLQRKRDKAEVDALLGKLKKKVPDRSFIKEEIFRFIKTQTYKEAVLEGVELLKDGKIDKLDKTIQRVLDVQATAAGGLGHFIVGNRVERYKRRKHFVADGVATGLASDEYMKSGGPTPGQLAGVVAPPGVGKTSTLVHLAKQAVLLSQQPILYVSLELSENMITDKFDASFTGIKIQELERKGNPRKVRNFMRQLGIKLEGEPIVVKEFPAGTISASHIEAYIRQLERHAFYPGVVFVDYADLLVPKVGSTGDAYEDAGNVYVDLRSMAQKLGILLWTAGQGNRASLGKKIITMRELADSFKKAMHADVLLALCQTEEEKKRHHARFFVMKNRNGLADLEFPVKLDWSRPRIINR